MGYSRFFRGLLKLALRITLLWILFAILFLALPSPVPSDESAVTTLNAMKSLTRVYRSDAFFDYKDVSPDIAAFIRSRRQYFIMEFQLQHSLNETSLSVGGGKKPFSFTNIFGIGDLTNELVSLSLPNATVSRDGMVFRTNAVELEDKFVVYVGKGDTDGISPAWFAKADAALIYWSTQPQSIKVPLRIRRLAEERAIEVWPDSWIWDKKYPLVTPPNVKPLIRITVPEDSNQPLQYEFPPHEDSTSPSKLYHARIILLSFLVPIALFVMFLFGGTFGLLQAVISLLAALTTFLVNIVALIFLGGCLYGVVWWFRNGRPSGAELKIKLARWAGIAVPAEDATLIDLEAQPTPRAQEQPSQPETPALVDVSDARPGQVPPPIVSGDVGSSK